MSRSTPHPGCLITFEGGEGTGKSTQIAYLAERLRSQRYTVRCTREPGGTDLGEAIRGVLMGRYEQPMPTMSELLLMFAARAAHLSEVIEPALAAGEIVLCDRFTDASYAYQGRARDLGDTPVAALEQLVQGERRPDGVIVLDLDVDRALERTWARGDNNRFDEEARVFHSAVRQAYRDRAARAPDHYAVIDASQTRNVVAEAIFNACKAWL